MPFKAQAALPGGRDGCSEVPLVGRTRGIAHATPARLRCAGGSASSAANLLRSRSAGSRSPPRATGSPAWCRAPSPAGPRLALVPSPYRCGPVPCRAGPAAARPRLRRPPTRAGQSGEDRIRDEGVQIHRYRPPWRARPPSSAPLRRRSSAPAAAWRGRGWRAGPPFPTRDATGRGAPFPTGRTGAAPRARPAKAGHAGLHEGDNGPSRTGTR